MGARGPAPTPTGILKLRGSWRAKERKGEPVAPEGRPSRPPTFSGKNGEHRKLWSKVIRLLESMPGVLTVVDGFQLERYCEQLIEWRQVTAEKNRLRGAGSLIGIIGHAVHGPIYSDLSKMAAKLDSSLKQIEKEFGLTPSARARLGCLRNGALDTVQKDDVESTYFGSEVG